MKLLDSKRAIEQYFADTYITTPIHWSGMKFDITTHSEWVYIEYKAEFSADSGLDNTKYSQDGYLNFTIVAKTPFRCTAIADVILDMFKGKKLSGLFAGRVSIKGQDYIAEIDKTSMDIEISLTTY
jgi:hypothetical protein